MKTIFTFVASLNVVPIAELKLVSVRNYYLERHPEATHLVMSDGGLCYAICGSASDAQAAMDKLNAVTSQHEPG